MRTLGVVTVARSDFGIYTPLLNAIKSDPSLRLQLLVTGMHLSPRCGYTARMVEDAYAESIVARVDMKLDGDTPEAIAGSMGIGVSGFAHVFGQSRPDILVVLGDRFDMHCAALAALPFKIPVAHIHGGELTEGAMDDALRHSMTKLSHLHFVSTGEYAQRVVQLGEEPWRVTVSGAPGLDNLHSVTLLDRKEMEFRFGLDLSAPPLLATFHPATLEYEKTATQAGEWLAALDACGLPVIFTAPNADTAGQTVRRLIEELLSTHTHARIVENFGLQGYFSMMDKAIAMVGNSSSGIIEAASFKLPVVNIGTRQKGRVRGVNVIDVEARSEEIVKAIRTVASSSFREGLRQLVNPYGDGHATKRILRVLKTVELGDQLVVKKFHDVK